MTHKYHGKRWAPILPTTLADGKPELRFDAKPEMVLALLAGVTLLTNNEDSQDDALAIELIDLVNKHVGKFRDDLTTRIGVALRVADMARAMAFTQLSNDDPVIAAVMADRYDGAMQGRTLRDFNDDQADRFLRIITPLEDDDAPSMTDIQERMVKTGCSCGKSHDHGDDEQDDHAPRKPSIASLSGQELLDSAPASIRKQIDEVSRLLGVPAATLLEQMRDQFIQGDNDRVGMPAFETDAEDEPVQVGMIEVALDEADERNPDPTNKHEAIIDGIVEHFTDNRKLRPDQVSSMRQQVTEQLGFILAGKPVRISLPK